MKRICRLLLSLPLLFLPLLIGCGPAALPAAGLSESREVTILMYHSVLHDPERTGTYVVTPETLEEDVAWLMENGYETVRLSDLAAFAEGRGELPEKPVVLTFDDGYLNNRTYVLPLLIEYDCCAALAVVGSYTARYSDAPDPNPSYAYLTWEDVSALALSGRFEIMSHTYDMHGESGRMGSGRRPGESDAAYERAFTADVARLQEELASRCRVSPAFFAYPFGVVGEGSRALLAKMGFSGSVTCREIKNVVTAGSLDGLWGLGRVNRPGQTSTEQFMKKVFG